MDQPHLRDRFFDVFGFYHPVASLPSSRDIIEANVEQLHAGHPLIPAAPVSASRLDCHAKPFCFPFDLLVHWFGGLSFSGGAFHDRESGLLEFVGRVGAGHATDEIANAFDRVGVQHGEIVADLMESLRDIVRDFLATGCGWMRSPSGDPLEMFDSFDVHWSVRLPALDVCAAHVWLVRRLRRG